MSEPTRNTVENMVSDKFGEVRDLLQERLRDGEAYVKSEPVQAIAFALAAGYVIRILPVGAIIRGIVRLGLTAVKPAGIVYAAAKAYELLQTPIGNAESTPEAKASNP